MFNKKAQIASGFSWFATTLAIFIILVVFLFFFFAGIIGKQIGSKTQDLASLETKEINNKLHTQFLLNDPVLEAAIYSDNKDKIISEMKKFRGSYFKEKCFIFIYGDEFFTDSSESFVSRTIIGPNYGGWDSYVTSPYYFHINSKEVSILFEECKNDK